MGHAERATVEEVSAEVVLSVVWQHSPLMVYSEGSLAPLSTRKLTAEWSATVSLEISSFVHNLKTRLSI
jgi:hypothetical protein